MASWNIKAPQSIDPSDAEGVKKMNSYLRVLNEQLQYMFENLDPEENYNSDAYLKVVSGEKAVASLEISVNQIQLSYVPKDGIIAAINLSEEGVRIQGSQIYMEGAISANIDEHGDPTFRVTEEGILYCTGAQISGDISASNISGSTISGTTITGSTITGTFIGTQNEGFYTSSGVVGFLGYVDTGGIIRSTKQGSVYNGASDDDVVVSINYDGMIGCTELYLLSTYANGRELSAILESLDGRITALEGSCSDDCSSDCSDTCADCCDVSDCMCDAETDELG